MLRLHGITPVMVSPFWDDEGLDENNLRRQIDFAINNGAAAVAGPGYASEFYKMSDGERYRFAEVLVDQAKKRVPVIIATSSDSTYLTIEFSKFAERMSADCLMVTPPRTTKLPASEIVEYYSRLCSAVSIPVMLQDADFTGAGLPADVFVDLAMRHENFLFTKLEIIMPGQKCAEIIERTNGRMQVIYGLGGIAMLDGLYRGASAFEKFWTELGVSGQWKRTGGRFLLWQGADVNVSGVPFRVPVAGDYARPLVVTPGSPEISVPLGLDCVRLHILGHVTLPGGYPATGKPGEVIASYTVALAGGKMREVPLRNGVEVARSNMIHEATRTNPIAAAAPRALIFTKDVVREHYQVLLYSLPVNGRVQSITLRLKAGADPLLVFAITAERV